MKKTNEIVIKLRSYQLCGETFYYPECDISRGICVMKKKKSINQRDVDFLKTHFEVEIS